MTNLELLVNEYKKARYYKTTIDTPESDIKGKDLAYWSEKLTEEMEKTNTPIDVVREMINS